MPEKTIHFDSPETVNALLAGDMVRNLKAALVAALLRADRALA